MNEKTVDKIKKLLNLGKKTCFAGEAEKAMALAMKLAAGIGVKLEDCEEKEKPQIESHLVWKEKASFSPWERRLAQGIANALGCVLVIHCGYKQQFELVGSEQDACIFDAMYPFILHQLRGLWKEYKISHGDSIYWHGEAFIKKSWYYGASARVYERAEEIFRANATQEEQQQYAIVVADKLVVCKAYMQKNMETTTGRSRKMRIANGAYGSGYAAGGRVSFASNRLAG